MCGICGIALVAPTNRIDANVLRRMADVVAYRGPDDDGMYVSDRIGLAMRRLSIIDLVGGKQPIHNEDSTLHIVFNGELYNYRDLRGELKTRGHAFRTDSDTEVVVHAYEEWGASCLDRFRGMFAFAIWDEPQETLLLAVDRFGIKPLYYGSQGNDFVFGSELACLLASDAFLKEVDHASLAEYFTLGYVPPPATIFRHARKLEPGTYLRWTPAGTASTERYWDVPVVAREEAPNDIRHELRERLRDAVRAHLVSDVPVGAFLSGGIDSSTVVALMSEVSEEPVRTFSIGFAAAEHDERPLARLVAERFKTQHQEFLLEPESAGILPKLVSHFQEPFADSSALPTYYVSKLARTSVKVALSGDGGDEMFAGYTAFLGVKLARHAQVLPASLRRGLRALSGRPVPAMASRWTDPVSLWQKRVADTMLSPDKAYKSKITMTGLSVVWPLLTEDLKEELAAHNPFRAVDRALAAAAAGTPVERAVYTALKVSLPGDMLVKVDRMSMANSLEVRVPLLDHVLAEFVAQIPVSVRFPRWRLKALLKDTMADSLPPELFRHRKHGFTIPLSAWFRGDLAGFATEVLLSRETRDRGYFDTKALEAFLHEHTHGRRNLGAAIWSILMFELWCRQILD
jgi:asparagine synthase (glutamine-hydrolysing)